MWKMKNILTEKQETERLKEYRKNLKLEKERENFQKKSEKILQNNKK